MLGARLHAGGGKGSNDGQGDQFDIGTTLAWRGTGTSFAPQTHPTAGTAADSGRRGPRPRPQDGPKVLPIRAGRS